MTRLLCHYSIYIYRPGTGNGVYTTSAITFRVSEQLEHVLPQSALYPMLTDTT